MEKEVFALLPRTGCPAGPAGAALEGYMGFLLENCLSGFI
jgi:hypothetical protein